MTEQVPILVITGPCGVGKTSVAVAMADMLDERDIAHALIDMDWLRQCAPRPADDRFHAALGYRNLAALWANYQAVGAKRLILVDIVEDASVIAAYQHAIPNAQIQVVQLTAELAVIEQRLTQRESGDYLLWHQRRATELLEHWRKNPIAARIFATDGQSVHAIAQTILQAFHWLDSAH